VTPLLSLVIGLIGWLPLILSAGLAQGDGTNPQIAASLGAAGGFALLGLFLGIVGLRRSRIGATGRALSTLGLLISGAVMLVVLVFALSFHL
jgi:hypothetical protein